MILKNQTNSVLTYPVPSFSITSISNLASTAQEKYPILKPIFEDLDFYELDLKNDAKYLYQQASQLNPGQTSNQNILATWAQTKTLTISGWTPLTNQEKIEEPEDRNTPLEIPNNFYNFETQVNFHDFDYLHNTPYLCSFNSEVDLLVLVAGATWEFERREILRKTWAGSILKSMLANRVLKPGDLVVKLVFYTGNSLLEPSTIPDSVAEKYAQNSPTNTSINTAIMQNLAQESNKFNDIIVENFAETYGNLTLKTLGQFKWANHFCPTAKFIMHVDSDVFVEWQPVLNLVSHLKTSLTLDPKSWVFSGDSTKSELFKNPNQPVCLTKYYAHSKVKIGKGKYQSNLKGVDYEGQTFPGYCEGSAFLIRTKLAYDIFKISQYTPMMNLEDVHTMGVLRNKLDILEPTKIDGNGIEICQHLSNAKFHKGIEYSSEIVEEKLILAWNRFGLRYSHFDHLVM